MTLPGAATREATRSLAAKYPQLTYRPLGETRLNVSQAGFGCYRVHVSVPEHRQALRQALESGVNLIDTSANYGDGGSEELVGQVVNEGVAAGAFTRESLVIVSKAGYLQGQNFELSRQRKQLGIPFPDIVPYADGLEHCIHPDFLSDQLTRSLKRLNLESLDVYLLHNPEYYLSWAAQKGIALQEARREYYRRIELAFQQLEREAANGRIRYYGISSNTFPSPASAAEFTSLERVWQIAEEIDNTHHFRVIQLPMNLLETGAAVEKNQSGDRSVLQFAHDEDLGVLINRPLNAIQGRGLIRLAETDASHSDDVEQMTQAIKEAAAAADPDWAKATSLSQTALRALRSTQGVTTALVGMRRPAYVEDVLAELTQPVEIRPRPASWERLRERLAAG